MFYWHLYLLTININGPYLYNILLHFIYIASALTNHYLRHINYIFVFCILNYILIFVFAKINTLLTYIYLLARYINGPYPWNLLLHSIYIASALTNHYSRHINCMKIMTHFKNLPMLIRFFTSYCRVCLHFILCLYPFYVTINCI